MKRQASKWGLQAGWSKDSRRRICAGTFVAELHWKDSTFMECATPDGALLAAKKHMRDGTDGWAVAVKHGVDVRWLVTKEGVWPVVDGRAREVG